MQTYETSNKVKEYSELHHLSKPRCDVQAFKTTKMLRIVTNKVSRNRMKVLYAIVLIGLIFYMQNSFLSERSPLNLKKYKATNKYLQVGNHTNFNVTVKISTKSIVKPTETVVKPTTEIIVNSTGKNILKFVAKPKSAYKTGHVNVHLWYKMCTGNLDSLRQMPLFPLWPSIRGQPEMPNELVSIMASRWSAQRIMGLLYPPVSGDYRFEISSATISEFWLSTSEDPEKAVLMARNNKNSLHGVNFAKGPLMPKSKPVHLDHGKVYYFEMIHGMNDIMRDQVQVRWMLPGAKDFTGIPKTSLSTVIINDTSLDMETRQLVLRSPSLALQEIILKKPKPHKWADASFSKPFEAHPSFTRENLNSLKFANSTKIMSAFKECDYVPSYTVRRKYNRYDGHWNTHFNDVFPDDDTERKIWQGQFESVDKQGNTLIPEHEVIVVVKLFMAILEAKMPGEYQLAGVVNVERNVDAKRGNRFFLELVLLEVKTKELQQFSEHVYQFKNSTSTICRPKGLKWSPTVKINAIITTKGQAPWIVHYIKSMADVLRATHDNNVHFIIVDFGNNGVNTEEELRRNGIKSFTLIKKTGIFHKTLAIDEAARSIKDENSIVFLTDLHLDVPSNIFESVRKHTIQGKMAYTPVVFRLVHCGRPESKQTTTTGHWESYGFGIFSSYKSDWNYFGGVNVEEFKNKWGGEDWEMADRVLSKGIEIERLRLPYFYHFFHDKSGMWEQA